MDISAAIRIEMARNGIGTNDLAKAIGTYPAKVSRTINGHRDPSFGEIEDYANALGLSMADLLERAINLARTAA